MIFIRFRLVEQNERLVPLPPLRAEPIEE